MATPYAIRPVCSALLALALTYGFLAALRRSRFGHALTGIRINEQRMRATGFSTYPYKLAAFTVSGALAGLAGFLFAVKDGFVNPELLSWHFSGAVLIMIILGGLGHLRGALVGAFAFALLQEFFQSEAVFGAFAKHWHLGLGLTIIISVATTIRTTRADESPFILQTHNESRGTSASDKAFFVPVLTGLRQLCK